MESQKQDRKRKVLAGGVLLLAVVMVMALTYKTEIASALSKSVTCTLALKHKPNDKLLLSETSPKAEELFYCQFPDVKQFTVQCKGETLHQDTKIRFLVVDEESDTVIAEKQRRAAVLLKKKKKLITLDIPKKYRDLEGHHIKLSIELINPEDTFVTVTANDKQGLVERFNDSEELSTNFIYNITYNKAAGLKVLYILLCLWLLGFVILCYVLLVWKRYSFVSCFAVFAFYMGITMNFLITPGGVPDEPSHIDTAYSLSNRMLRAGNSSKEGIIYKRLGDVRMSNQIVNGMENNSYYQMKQTLFCSMSEQERELIPVSGVNTTNAVPTFIYGPAAVGISIGRLLHCSYFLTIMLGRLVNLIVYVLLCFFALRIIPAGKYMLSAIMLLPIALQEAASISYDAVINGILFLFLALLINLSYSKGVSAKQWMLLAVLGIMVALVKGGVYLPLLLFGILIYRQQKTKSFKKWQLGIAAGGLVVVIAAFFIKYLPTVLRMLSPTKGELVSVEEGACYTMGYVLTHPHRFVYAVWNTIIQVGDNNLAGLLGGRLAWLGIQPNWFLLIILLITILLLTHVEGDTIKLKIRDRIVYCLSIVATVGLIMLSMYVSFTVSGAAYVQGLQGRYFLCLFPLACFLLRSPMVHVEKIKTAKISMVLLMTMAFILLRVYVLVLNVTI